MSKKLKLDKDEAAEAEADDDDLGRKGGAEDVKRDAAASTFASLNRREDDGFLVVVEEADSDTAAAAVADVAVAVADVVVVEDTPVEGDCFGEAADSSPPVACLFEEDGVWRAWLGGECARGLEYTEAESVEDRREEETVGAI